MILRTVLAVAFVGVAPLHAETMRCEANITTEPVYVIDNYLSDAPTLTILKDGAVRSTVPCSISDPETLFECENDMTRTAGGMRYVSFFPDPNHSDHVKVEFTVMAARLPSENGVNHHLRTSGLIDYYCTRSQTGKQ